MAAHPVILVLGAGPRIGASLAKKFAGLGYRVALASRSGTGSRTAEGFLSLKADLTQPDSVPALFSAVKSELQAAPTVVVYNTGALTAPPVAGALFSIPVDKFVADLNINIVNPYVAAQQAVAGWASLPKDAKKTFIYTGNIQNTFVIPSQVMLTAGVGKSGSAYWIGTADVTKAVDGARFFYADERNPDGTSKGGRVDGGAHADFYAQLAAHEGDVPWHATFVKDKGYTKF